MNKFIFLIFSAMLIFFSSCTKDEAIMTATISGYVTDYADANAPIAGATVTINTKGMTKTTGSDGRYEFTAIEPGTYTLQVTANGYKTTTKQTTVYAGETTNLDFQLSPAEQDVEVLPQMLSFGPQNDNLTFSIKNNENRSLQYSISNYPNYISVSPSSGSISAKGTQSISVNLNRNLLDSNTSCQLLVNIGNDSYPVNISINSQDVSEKITATPSLLDFGTNYNELQFTIKNIGTSGDLNWTIAQPTESCISVTPSSGTTAVGKSTQVTVKLNRTNMPDNLQSFININIPGGSVSVQVIGQAGNNETDGNNPASDEIAVKANLLAYYTFDDGNMLDAFENELHGQLINNPTFIDDTPNGTGKAISLNSTKEQFAKVPYTLFANRTAYSINFWIKDFGAGTIFSSLNSEGQDVCPSSYAADEGYLQYRFSHYGLPNLIVDFSYQYKTIQDGNWHMVSFVINRPNHSNNIVDLYVDGIKVDTGSKSSTDNEEALSIQFGGISSMKLDNIRFYGINLTASEIQEIYNAEK